MHSGIYGTVRDLSGNFLAGAHVSVGKGRKVVKTAEEGDYWRLLNPGMYEVTVSLAGIQGTVSRSVRVGSNPTRVDFVLELKDGRLFTSNKTFIDDKTNEINDKKNESTVNDKPHSQGDVKDNEISRSLNEAKVNKSSSPGVVAIVLLSVAGVLLIVIVVMVLYYRKARKDYDYSKMEFT